MGKRPQCRQCLAVKKYATAKRTGSIRRRRIKMMIRKVLDKEKRVWKLPTSGRNGRGKKGSGKRRSRSQSKHVMTLRMSFSNNIRERLLLSIARSRKWLRHSLVTLPLTTFQRSSKSPISQFTPESEIQLSTWIIFGLTWTCTGPRTRWRVEPSPSRCREVPGIGLGNSHLGPLASLRTSGGCSCHSS